MHLRHRRALQPAFHSQRIAEDYLAHFAGAARRGSDRWSDGGEIDLVTEMSAMTLVGAGAALFGSDLREPAPEITRALTSLLAGFRRMAGGPACSAPRCPLPLVRSAKAELENVVDDLYADVGPVSRRLDRCWIYWLLGRNLPSRSGTR